MSLQERGTEEKSQWRTSGPGPRADRNERLHGVHYWATLNSFSMDPLRAAEVGARLVAQNLGMVVIANLMAPANYSIA